MGRASLGSVMLTEVPIKVPEWMNMVHNSGDDMAGIVHTVGDNVTAFHPGDRVAAFHVMRAEHGSFAEYGLAPQHTTFHIPKKTTFEEAAAVPLAAMTAAVGLFIRLGLPQPWTGGRQDGEIKEDSSATQTGPLVVYGAASAVGAYAIQLAKRANVGPIIAVAGRGIAFVEGLLDKSAGDVIVDYRKGNSQVVSDIKAAVKTGAKLRYCFDAVSEHNSFQNVSQCMDEPGSKITLVLPGRDYSAIPKHIESSQTMVGDVHGKQTDFGQAWFTLFGKGLREGWFKGHPTTVIPGGLNGVEEGLKNLKDSKASATKYVFRIADTLGAGS